MRATTPLPVDPGSLRLLTMTEVAREVRCSTTYVYRIIGGKAPSLPPLPILRIGSRFLVRFETLAQWVTFLECRETEEQRMTGLFRMR
jgi:hypothetical protein